ncbi:MAG: phosphoglycerate kinase [Candidatus Magasanikbacteria bacterium CG_4_9_14_0_2_um_filter_41_10]|uniref:Phosphoglycerate kinase n=1 Tax=Candidatus Magasanikbacteria bacterium CG_4_10_14_0_2_um_filter_41_31 TaxID=1974639 RepID=A0A2M7V4D1_9BACT|nr:MAG: phosphoglycerate kinase [Candidatus Magasanikbacteria bacterium CG1_02_41_34]PIZ93308.1 MAG: phosphoglycerate kinase [Candidatus Magasanikbacteria bacterium CG_4_10_14_0_2_um_filter_41_31]PJC53942.1 MAG: phosphoglycerate kinase [Candidatus Magasanikbacteria bacterium CG_4_9_14_0_2_um_filter_41_10]
MNSITKARNLSGKVVLVRVDFNVPIKKKKVLDDFRLVASLPTIQYLIEKGAKVVLMTHIGRPEGKTVASLKVDPVVERLSELLKKKVKKLETGNWKLSDAKKVALLKEISKLRPGQVAMMENMRFSKEEAKDTGMLSQELAALGDVFVLDGFAVAHRASASVSGIPKYIKGYAGKLLTTEIVGLTKVLHNPNTPFVAVLGGAKMETKIPVMRNLVERADAVLIGGGIVNTYLLAKGYIVGDSLVDKEFQVDAIQYCKRKNVIKPLDVIVGTKDGKKVRVVKIKKNPHEICKKGEAIFDIGPETLRLFATYIKEAKTLVWNGAMGYFEKKPYDVATLTVARLVASRSKGSAFGVIGGGETLQAMDMVGMTDDIDLVSTGGGAMLEFLAGKTLPGIYALQW